jgi:AraC-like DNA-binding protein
MSEESLLRGSTREILPKQKNLSWQRLDRRLVDGIPFIWHHHPEIELTLTSNCRGQRFIGDHVSSFEDGDLTLVGSNLPHSWTSNERVNRAQPFHARVIWFESHWLKRIGQSSAELASLETLAQASQRGLTFSQATQHLARPLIEKLFALTPQEGFTTLLELLCYLSLDQEAVPLASQAVITADGEGYDRVDRVLHYLHENYTETIRLEELAGIAALSPSALHRMFRKHLQTTISDYLTVLRIGEASARIASSDTPIGIISHEVGYASQANFNRHFLKLRSVTPRQYRKTYRRA